MIGPRWRAAPDPRLGEEPPHKVGRDAQAATDVQLRAQILSYSRARGLFAGVTINGSTVRQDQDANERFYGKRLQTNQIVFGPSPGAPEPVNLWLQTLDKYSR